MKTYIYKGIDDYQYHASIVAKLGDILEIDSNEIRNVSYSNKLTRVTYEVLENLLKNCEEYDPTDGIDLEDEDLSEKSGSFNRSIILRLYSLNINTIHRLIDLGVLKISEDSCRNYNVGKSNYSKHVIQPWAIWQDYELNPWDADIVKRILRTKAEEGLTEKESRILDYKKIIHICQERLRQLNGNV